MNTAITLDKKHYEMAAAEATAAGLTVAEFLCTLIDAHTKTFDEILAPVREGFEATSDQELDDLFNRARTQPRSRD